MLSYIFLTLNIPNPPCVCVLAPDTPGLTKKKAIQVARPVAPDLFWSLEKEGTGGNGVMTYWKNISVTDFLFPV